MPRETVSQAAERLHQEHQKNIDFTPLAQERRNDLDFAYSVQEALVNRMLTDTDSAIGGWKIGLSTKSMQKFAGVDVPIAGAILSSRIHESSIDLECSRFGRLGIEMELAVHISPDLSDDTEFTVRNPRSFIDRVCAAFELIDDRNADYTTLDAASIASDNSWNAGIVLGRPVDVTEEFTMLGRKGVLERADSIIGTGLTDDAGGDPVDMVVWLASLLRQRGRRLVGGQWIMTGSLIPTVFVQSGESYRFTIEGMPSVEVRIR